MRKRSGAIDSDTPENYLKVHFCSHLEKINNFLF